MNTIGIDNNLDRPRIKKLLVIGLFASFLTGIGDFMLGYGAAENMENYGLAASVLASAPNLADWQMIAGGLLGFFGIFLEGLAYLDDDLAVITIYGSEDRVLNMKKLEEGEQFLPPAAVSCMIEGGNHAQFGNYGPQSGDGEAAISAAEQQSQTEEIILHNILSDN